MTLVGIKLSLASVSLCNWVLKLEIVLWSFMAITISEEGAIKAFNNRKFLSESLEIFIILE
jgi:hypothetical protein